MIEILSNALWITLSAYLFFIIGKRIYNRYIKQNVESYFYFLSLNKEEAGNWFLRIDAPKDDFDIEIIVSLKSEILLKKNARLKAGINRILISLDLNETKEVMILVKSEKQKIERPFTEFLN